VITSPIERRTIALNASKTTDDYDRRELNFTWTIPGPSSVAHGVATTRSGSERELRVQEWNNSYAVLLSVRDTALVPSGRKPGT